MSPVLQEARVDILDLSLCNSTQWYRGRVRSTNVCAGYPEGNIDTCQVTVPGVPLVPVAAASLDPSAPGTPGP